MGLLARPVSQQVPREIDESALAAFGCDVCFVGDVGEPVDDVIRQEIERSSDAGASEVVERGCETICAAYDAGEFIGHRAQLPAGDANETIRLAFERVNRVLFAQQTVSWLLGSDLKLRLYGRGWEANPKFAVCACGSVGDEATRRLIARASRINLAADPFGVVDADLSDSVESGGFYLMRFCPGDMVERFYPPLARACARLGIESNAGLRAATDPGVRRLVSFLCRTVGIDVLTDWPDFVPWMLSIASGGKVSSAAAIWSGYPSVCFSTRDELLGLCSRYLYDTQARQQLCEQMRGELCGTAPVRVQVDRSLLARLSIKDGVAA